MSSVFGVVGNALYSKLSGTSAITDLLANSTYIFPIVAPDNIDFSYIVYSLHSGAHPNQTPVETKNNIYFIRAYSNESAKTAGEIDKQIDIVLHKKPLTVAGWDNFWIARDTDLENFESAQDGTKVYMRGGLYRIRLAKE